MTSQAYAGTIQSPKGQGSSRPVEAPRPNVKAAGSTLVQRVGAVFGSRLTVVLLTLVPILAFSAVAVLFGEQIKQLEALGYVGVFLLNIFASASFVVPLPGLPMAFAAAAVWSPIGVMLAGATGSTLGETVSYLAGSASRDALNGKSTKGKWRTRLEGWLERRGFVTVTVISAVPLPLFDLVGFIMGSMGYSFKRFMLACLLGRLVKYTAVVLAGVYAAPLVTRLLG